MTVARTRIVLATPPTMLGDIVRQLLAAHPDLEVAAEVSDPDALAAAVRRTGAEVVVVTVADGDGRLPDGLPRSLLREHPRLTLIALRDDARSAFVYELRLHETVITEISPRILLAAIRSDGRA